jgi:hypothetical protein
VWATYSGEFNREIGDRSHDAADLCRLVGDLKRCITNPAGQVAVDAAIGVQDGVERKLLGGTSAGMLGHEIEGADALTGQQLAGRVDDLGQVRLQFGNKFRVA